MTVLLLILMFVGAVILGLYVVGMMPWQTDDGWTLNRKDDHDVTPRWHTRSWGDE